MIMIRVRMGHVALGSGARLSGTTNKVSAAGAGMPNLRHDTAGHGGLEGALLIVVGQTGAKNHTKKHEVHTKKHGVLFLSTPRALRFLMPDRTRHTPRKSNNDKNHHRLNTPYQNDIHHHYHEQRQERTEAAPPPPPPPGRTIVRHSHLLEVCGDLCRPLADPKGERPDKGIPGLGVLHLDQVVRHKPGELHALLGHLPRDHVSPVVRRMGGSAVLFVRTMRGASEKARLLVVLNHGITTSIRRPRSKENNVVLGC